MARTVLTPSPCSDCRGLTKRRHHKTGEAVCYECQEKRTLQSIVDMHHKRGPTLVTWLAAMSRALETVAAQQESASESQTLTIE